MAAHAKLPAELADAIIDHLYGEYSALAACALVCKAWLPASRYHFWRDMRLTCSAEEVKRFTELLSISPEVAHYIRTVQLVGRCVDAYAHLESDVLHTALETLSRLPALASVALVGLRFRERAGTSLPAHARSPPPLAGVAALAIRDCTFPGFSDLATVVRACPALAALRLDGAWWGCGAQHSAPAQGMPARTMRLRTLELGDCFSRRRVVEWVLSASASGASIEALRLTHVGAPDVHLLDLVALAGPALRQLEIRLRRTASTPGYGWQGYGAPQVAQGIPAWPSLDLSPCTGLRTLALEFSAAPNDLRAFVAWFSDLLSRNNAPALEEINVRVRPDESGCANEAAASLSAGFWAEMSETLHRPNLCALKRISIAGCSYELKSGIPYTARSASRSGYNSSYDSL